MVTRTTEIYGETAQRVASELRPILVDLIAISLQGKQLHWNVRGPMFRSVHEQLDEIVGDTRAWADLVAERMITLGVPASGQASDIARDSSFDALPEGSVQDRDAIAMMVDRLNRLSSTSRRSMNQLGETDLVTQDMVMGIVQALEKHLWMLRSQQT